MVQCQNYPESFPLTVEGIKLRNIMTNTSIEVKNLDRRTVIKVIPQINERLNNILIDSPNHLQTIRIIQILHIQLDHSY